MSSTDLESWLGEIKLMEEMYSPTLNRCSHQKFSRGDVIRQENYFICIFPERSLFISVERDQFGISSDELLEKFLRYLYIKERIFVLQTKADDWYRTFVRNVQSSTTINKNDYFPELEDLLHDWINWVFNLSDEEITELHYGLCEVAKTFLGYLEIGDRLKLQLKLGIDLEKTIDERYYEQLTRAC